MMGLLLDAVRAAVRAVATRLLDWAAPPPAPAPLRLVSDPAEVGYEERLACTCGRHLPCRHCEVAS